MAYKQDLANSARRHLQAANALDENKDCRAVAGYLYGIAAECALKKLMWNAGMRPQSKRPSRDDADPFYLHFPQLKSALADRLKGRNGSALLKFTKTEVMREWDTDMRYAPRANIADRDTDRWKQDAMWILKEMDKE